MAINATMGQKVKKMQAILMMTRSLWTGLAWLGSAASYRGTSSIEFAGQVQRVPINDYIQYSLEAWIILLSG